MFEVLFKYPYAAFARGHLVLLSAWPAWVLVVSIVMVALGLGMLTWRRLASAGASAARLACGGLVGTAGGFDCLAAVAGLAACA